MPYKVSDEAKEYEGNMGEYLGFGVHEVALVGAETGQLDSGTDYIKFFVEGKNGEEENVMLWLTEKSEKYTFATVKGLYTHLAPEDKKEKARAALEAAPDYDEIAKMFAKTYGGIVWIDKYPDPERTYLNGNGERKHSINVNIYGYKPKLREELLPKETETKPENKIEGEDVSNDPKIPKDDDWA